VPDASARFTLQESRGCGREQAADAAFRPWQIGAFASGWMALVVALLSPVAASQRCAVSPST